MYVHRHSQLLALAVFAALCACGTPSRGPDTVDALAGGERGCLVVDGRVECWHPDVPGRRRVEGVAAAQELAVGRAHACARTESGAVLCWDLAGAPGRAVPETGDATAVHALGDRTCVLHRSGGVSCWSRKASQAMAATPTTLPWLTDAVELSLGEQQDCARRRAGEVLCWDAPLHPWRVDGLAAVRGLAGSCAVQEDGVVACWCDAPGRLSDPLMAVEGLAGPVRALASSRDLVCGLRAGGEMMCWGDAWAMPHDVAPMARPQAMAAPASSADGAVLDASFVAVAGSRRHVCGLTAGGLVVCWRDRIREPTVWRPGGAGWRALEGGHDHVCARSSTETVCAVGAEFAERRFADPTLQVVSLPGPIGQTFMCAAPSGGPLRCEAPGQAPVTTTLVADLSALTAGEELLCGRDGAQQLQCFVHKHLFGVDPSLAPARSPVPGPGGAGALDNRVAGLHFVDRDGALRHAAADLDEAANGGIFGSLLLTADEMPASPVAITGDRHAICVLSAGGEVRCGGDATRDLSGRDRRVLPARPLPGVSAVELLGGAASLCARTTAGALLCGRLNDVCRAQPALEAPVIRSIPAGAFVRGDWANVRDAGCVRDERGRLVCWGDCPRIPGLDVSCRE